MPDKASYIRVKGARMHNLQNIDVEFPIGKLIVVTGVSGSGKSSLTMDTLFAEGQRRYVESLSAYARQFMKSMPKPEVDVIEGLCPAIAIEQKVSARTPRSTVGSMTETNDYLRLLFAKIGKTFSPVSGQIVRKDEVSDVVDWIVGLPEGSKVFILIPFSTHTQVPVKQIMKQFMEKGFSRMFWLENEMLVSLEELLAESHPKTEGAYLLIDRMISHGFDEDEKHRLADSIQTAFDETLGDVFIYVSGQGLKHFCNRFELDGIRFEEPSPNFFSSNNPYGACPKCEGFGQVLGIDPNLVIPNRNLSVYEGAVACWQGEKLSEYKQKFIRAHHHNFPIHKPIRQLSAGDEQLLWKGKGGIDDFFRMVEENLYKIQYRVLQARYRGKTLCPECNGARIRKDAQWVKIQNTSIAEILDMPVKDLAEWLNNLSLDEYDQLVARRILTELQTRVETLMDVGLSYLTLNRPANTLSGGESQRIQLTRVIGSNLNDSLYILDEPSIGLHARDTSKLIGVLKRLRNMGNTVIVVEHDELIMREADYIIDVGPLASHLGGKIVAAGPYQQLLKVKDSLTAQYLKGKLTVSVDKPKRAVINKLVFNHCNQHNLKDISVSIPLNMLCVVSGVSGSGKTSLIRHIVYPAIMNALNNYTVKPGEFESMEGDIHALDAVEMVDQNPIGKSSRSNPVTYIKAYDDIRQVFAQQQLSKIRGYGPGHFSFNVDGGRCDTCKGEGETIVEMQFLADVHLTCEHCKGRRFKQEILDIQYKGKNIHEILEMSVNQALDHFEGDRKIRDKLSCLQQVGLGYIKLGQSSDTLSGGEAQRVKLASFLDKSYHQKHILFIFDEPTTGLHFHDIQKLLQSFEALIEQGHSLIVIEHNPDVLRNADWIIDLGPEGGQGGGEILYAGPVKGLSEVKESHTARFMQVST